MFQKKFIKRYPVPAQIKELSSVFFSHGYRLYIVGGAIRDYLLGVENHDFDFCTSATPEQVMGMFKRVIPTGIKHGTVTIMIENTGYEVTTFRVESSYSDYRHPDKVNFTSDLEQDLSRRDFTVNAFACDCETGLIIDLFGGMRDLRCRKIRCIGVPDERFNEDALRLLRMCRFCSKLDFKADKKTLKSAGQLSSNIIHVSAERLHDETNKLLMSDNPQIGLSLMLQTGILKYIIPEFSDKTTSFDLIVSAVKTAAQRKSPEDVRWALFFYLFGEDKADVIMKRLKFSNSTREKVLILIRNQKEEYTPEWTDASVKRFINKVGSDNLFSLFEMQMCKKMVLEKSTVYPDYEEFKKRTEKLKNDPLTLKDLSVDGTDLIKIGVSNGPDIGRILNILLNEVIDNPGNNTQSYLLSRARQLSSAV